MIMSGIKIGNKGVMHEYDVGEYQGEEEVLEGTTLKSVGFSTDLSVSLFHVGETIGVGVVVVFVGGVDVAGGVVLVVVGFGYSTVHCSHILQ